MDRRQSQALKRGRFTSFWCTSVWRRYKFDIGGAILAMATIGLAPEYGYVIAALLTYVFFNFWMAFQVGKARKLYNVPYPTLYASESENNNGKLFNCVQRGHQNSLEVMPIFLVLLLLGGLKHPRLSALFGAFYVLGRYFYFKGYASGDPKNRLKLGRIGFLALLGLKICTISLAVSLIRAA